VDEHIPETDNAFVVVDEIGRIWGNARQAIEGFADDFELAFYRRSAIRGLLGNFLRSYSG